MVVMVTAEIDSQLVLPFHSEDVDEQKTLSHIAKSVNLIVRLNILL